MTHLMLNQPPVFPVWMAAVCIYTVNMTYYDNYSSPERSFSFLNHHHAGACSRNIQLNNVQTKCAFQGHVTYCKLCEQLIVLISWDSCRELGSWLKHAGLGKGPCTSFQFEFIAVLSHRNE